MNNGSIYKRTNNGEPQFCTAGKMQRFADGDYQPVQKQAQSAERQNVALAAIGYAALINPGCLPDETPDWLESMSGRVSCGYVCDQTEWLYQQQRRYRTIYHSIGTDL